MGSATDEPVNAPQFLWLLVGVELGGLASESGLRAVKGQNLRV